MKKKKILKTTLIIFGAILALAFWVGWAAIKQVVLMYFNK